jgi:DNA-binding YbaB/EbfC family protein
MVNMSNLLQQAQKAQEEMQKVQEGLAAITVEGSSGGGMVRVKANARNELISVSIEPEVLQPGEKEMLEDLIVAAVNQALKQSQERAQQEMQKVAGSMLGGLNLPANFKFPGF